jgi:hypothetical protein
MTHFTVYQSHNGSVTELYEYEYEDQAQDEVDRINRNLQLAGVPSTVSYAFYDVEQIEFTDKQLDCIKEMVESYRAYQLDLYDNPPSVTLFTKTQRELFKLLDLTDE